MNELEISDDFIRQDIKKQNISEKELETLYAITNSYEALFSKRARLYKERNLKEAALQDEDFKTLILEHYTFLKRPVIVHNDAIFIGNSKKTVAAAKQSITGN